MTRFLLQLIKWNQIPEVKNTVCQHIQERVRELESNDVREQFMTRKRKKMIHSNERFVSTKPYFCNQNCIHGVIRSRENEVAAMGGRAENTAWSFQPGHISVANKAYRHLPKAQNKNAKWRMERPFDRENWQRYGLTVRLTNLGVETIDQRVATADRRFMNNRCVDLHERVDVPQTTCTREVTFEYRLAVTKKKSA